MNLRPRRADEPEINLVSLIDVVLMIVIFFMLSSPFNAVGRLKIRLPEAGAVAAARGEAQPIVVVVGADGSYVVNGRDVVGTTSDALRAALLAIAGDGRDARVTVRADARATHQSVVSAMDVLGRMGFREMNIATVKEGALP
ncbi:MAG: ExbD/TolR family protein [Gemmatimonadota bacterium]